MLDKKIKVSEVYSDSIVKKWRETDLFRFLTYLWLVKKISRVKVISALNSYF